MSDYLREQEKVVWMYSSFVDVLVFYLQQKLNMNWQSRERANHFLTRANAIHPEEAFDNGEKFTLLAAQDLFYECYMNSFSRDKVIEFLEKGIAGDVKVPEDADEQLYKRAFIKKAVEVLDELKNN
jgi:hypothetical protein